MTSTIRSLFLGSIGTGTARFPSGVAIPALTDAATDPLIQTRVSKHVQVDCNSVLASGKKALPGLILLHEAVGLTAQIKDVGARLACEGYAASSFRTIWATGGMVTANVEVADALMGKLKRVARPPRH